MFWPATSHALQKIRTGTAFPEEKPLPLVIVGNDLELF
jgi:hypothetical protein